MDYGFDVPVQGPLASPKSIEAMARRGEELGFAYVYVSDHLVFPKGIESRYPYSQGGDFPGTADYLEQLTMLAFLAGQTSTIRLMTSVMVVPYRAAVHTAKILSTIDVLSRGRLVVGCGVGWMREEFEALAAPPYGERGAVTDEYIRAFKELWTSDDPSVDGKYVRFSNIAFEPKPVQKPHPPIWIGGESPRALRRTAELGDCWYPIGINPTYPVRTADQLREYLGRLDGYAREIGRDPSTIDVAYHTGAWGHRATQPAAGEDRRPFTGTSAEIAGDIRAFGDAGVKHLFFGFQGSSLQETLDNLARFTNEVRPLAQGSG